MDFFLTKNKKTPNEAGLPENPVNMETQETFFTAIRALLYCLKEFSLDIEELKTKEYRKSMENLSEKFMAGNRTKKILSAFDKDKKKILLFINKQKSYIDDREKEFRDIIELLNKAMLSLNSENQNFNQKIFQRSEKIEGITLLDDIKEIKNALKQEVNHIKTAITEKQKYDADHLNILSSQVNSLKTELKKAKTAAVVDGLTGLRNRKAFDDFIADLVAQNSVIDSEFSILMVDIDDFKQVNDLYGHQTGDEALTTVAQRCEKLTRDTDFSARYGGEEFVIILMGASLKNAIKKANQICNDISSTDHLMKTLQDNKKLKLTISIGIATFNKKDTAETVIGRADKALYAAKALGKNRAVSEEYIK